MLHGTSLLLSPPPDTAETTNAYIIIFIVSITRIEQNEN